MNIALVEMIQQPHTTNTISPVGQCFKSESVLMTLDRVNQYEIINGTNTTIYEVVDEDERTNENSTVGASNIKNKNIINYSFERYLLTKMKVERARLI